MHLGRLWTSRTCSRPILHDAAWTLQETQTQTAELNHQPPLVFTTLEVFKNRLYMDRNHS